MLSPFTVTSLRSYRLRLVAATVLVAFAAPGAARAQDVADDSSRGKHLGVYFSVGLASYRDDLIVPLAFNGPALSLGGAYSAESEDDLFYVRLRIGMGHLENRYSHEAWVLMQDIRMSWVKRLAGNATYGRFWAGVSIPLQMNNLFFESWDDAHLYWLTAYSLAGAVMWQKEVSPKSDATIRVEIPLLGWVSRPPTYRYEKQEPLGRFSYTYTEPNRSLHFETVDDFRNVFVQMLWERDVRRSLLQIGLEFQFYYCRQPEKFLGSNTFVVLSYLWRVGR